MDRISEMGENSYPNSSIDDVSVDSQEGSIERNRNSRRHTPSQVQALEAAFGENQYPDRRQKMELSTRLSMTSTQVQYWFQNRRTRLKVQMERNTRSTLELENRMLKAENFILRNPTPTLLMNSNERYRAAMSSAIPTAEHTVRVENAPTLEVGLASSSLSVPIQVPQPMQVVGRVQESDYLNIALRASGILIRMAQTNEPLWVPDSFSGGKQILNHDEYMRMFPRVGQRPDGFVTEATRAYGLVNFPRSALVHGLMDPVKWKAMFPGMIAKAGIIEVVTSGDRDTRNGALQLMYARQQVMTPLVPFRDTKFIRFCQRYLPGVWIIVDVPIDNNREGLPAFYYRRLPSGCIIYDMPDRKSAVQWIEHAEYDGRHIHQVYRLLMNMGLGAEKWLATLQRQCEYFATVYDPSPDSRPNNDKDDWTW